MSRIPLNPLDSLFLMLDTPATPMHVGGLLRFTPPDDVPHDWLRHVVDDCREMEVSEPWNRRLVTHRVKQSPVHWWTDTDDIDLEYHVRRTALPSPGDERELGILVARLHSNPLDLSRPPWEMHVIEGLADGTFAMYAKIHHALVDGMSAVRLMGRSMSRSPDDTTTPLFVSSLASQRAVDASRDDGDGDEHRDGGGGLLAGVTGAAGAALEGALGTAGTAATSASQLTRSVAGLARSRLRHSPELVAPMSAGHNLLNSRITRQRRFATQLYSLDRLRRLAKDTGTTLNDVVLSICGGGLRTYLSELGALPDKPLIAFLPVDVRSDTEGAGGNAVGAILSSLGTDVADPLERLHVVHASAARGKQQMEGMDQATALAYSAALMAPATLQVVGAFAKLPQPRTNFNLCISNVPGPREPLYFRGARLDAIYPMSIPTHGMALNITLESCVDALGFGFIGCRETLPSLQRLAVQTGEALEALERAVHPEG